MLQVRCTEEELALVDLMADEDSHTRSTLIRDLIKEECKRRVRVNPHFARKVNALKARFNGSKRR